MPRAPLEAQFAFPGRCRSKRPSALHRPSGRRCPNPLLSIWDLMSGRRLTCRRSKCRAATSYCPKSGFVSFHNCPCFGLQASHPKAGKLCFLFLHILAPFFHVVQVASEGFRSDLCNTEHLTSVGPRNRNSSLEHLARRSVCVQFSSATAWSN